MHGWWWHLFHDPMRDNLSSVILLIIVLAAAGAMVWYRPWRVLRRRHLHQRRYPCDADDCLTCRTVRKQ